MKKLLQLSPEEFFITIIECAALTSGTSFILRTILPQKWQYLVSASTKKQFGVLKDLMNRTDVDSIVCATDAG